MAPGRWVARLVAEQQNNQSTQLDELLAELRVILPGTQILFGFLLAVPFSARYTEVTEVG